MLSYFSTSFKLYLRNSTLDQNTLLLLIIKKKSNIHLPRSKVVHGFTCQVKTHKHVLFVNITSCKQFLKSNFFDKNIVVKSLLNFLQLLFLVNHQIIPSDMETLYVLQVWWRSGTFHFPAHSALRSLFGAELSRAERLSHFSHFPTHQQCHQDLTATVELPGT